MRHNGDRNIIQFINADFKFSTWTLFNFFTYSFVSLWTSFFLLDIIFITGFTLYRTKTERKKLTIKYIRSNTTWETIILQTPPPLPSPPLFFPPPPPLLFPLFFHIFINPLRLKWQKKSNVNPNHDQKSLDGKKHLYLKFMILRKFFILSFLSSNVMLKLLQLWYLNGAVGGIVVEPLMTRQ